MGSRYGGLKQLEGFGPAGELILDYSIYDALHAGFGKVVFVVRSRIRDLFEEKVGARYRELVPVEYVLQDASTAFPKDKAAMAAREKPWGTGHAVLSARDVVQGAFAVINADDFYGRAGFQKLAAFCANTAPGASHALLVAFALHKTLSAHGGVSRGVCQVENGLLTGIVETEQIQRNPAGELRGRDRDGESVLLEDDTCVSMNLWGFSPAIFPALELAFSRFAQASGHLPKAEFYLPTAVDQLMREVGWRCQVEQSPDRWTGVTNPEDRESVRAFFSEQVAAGCYPSPLQIR